LHAVKSVNFEALRNHLVWTCSWCVLTIYCFTWYEIGVAHRTTPACNFRAISGLPSPAAALEHRDEGRPPLDGQCPPRPPQYALCHALTGTTDDARGSSRLRHGIWVSIECRATFRSRTNHLRLQSGAIHHCLPSAVRIIRPDDDKCWCVAMTHRFVGLQPGWSSHPARPTRQPIHDRPLTTGGEHLSGENDTEFYGGQCPSRCK
jgi:hypothetical protein